MRFGEPDDLDRRLADWIVQPHGDEVQAEHSHQRVEQGMENLRWITDSPDTRKRKQTDKIVDAPLKALNLSGGLFVLDVHIRQPRRMGKFAYPGVHEARAETPPEAQRTDFVAECRR